MEVDHNILIGDSVVPVKVEGQIVEGKLRINIESLKKAQVRKAHELLGDTDKFDVDLFNFAIEVSGLLATEIAALIGITSAYIGRVRHGKEEKPSPMFWKMFRLTMISVFERDLMDQKSPQRKTDEILRAPAA